MQTNYKEGDLVRLRSRHRRWTILADPSVMELREYPTGMSPLLQSNNGLGPKKTLENFEEKTGLIVKVIRNRLDQPMGYRVLIGKETWFCKSIVAEKYFILVETKGDESR